MPLGIYFYLLSYAPIVPAEVCARTAHLPIDMGCWEKTEMNRTKQTPETCLGKLEICSFKTSWMAKGYVYMIAAAHGERESEGECVFMWYSMHEQDTANQVPSQTAH